MRRFFSSCENTQANLSLSKDDINHLLNVLRLEVGDEIIICDGKATDYLCAIKEISKAGASFEILSSSANQAESAVKITLFQGLPKSDKMDLIVQKAVELGVNSIIPVESERSVAKIKDGGEKKIARWQSISEAAAKQSGRGIIPKIGSAINFDKACEQMSSYNLALIAYELETSNSLKKIVKNHQNLNNLAIFIGPEGGISDKEATLAKSKGIIPITLGKRILRSESAGFMAIILSLAAVGEYE